MARRFKAPTIDELRASIRSSFDRWNVLHRHGGVDPFFADGTNMNLVRNHIIYYQVELKDFCKKNKVAKCPREVKLKLPRIFSDGYRAPGSRAGPCRRKPSAADRARIIAAQKKRWAKVLRKKRSK